MAKVTLEAEVEENLIEEFVGTIKELGVLSRANEDLSESMGFLAKTIGKNTADIRKLTKSVEGLMSAIQATQATGK
jgi:phage host-nuclease inhibitor protein Gam